MIRDNKDMSSPRSVFIYGSQCKAQFIMLDVTDISDEIVNQCRVHLSHPCFFLASKNWGRPVAPQENKINRELIVHSFIQDRDLTSLNFA